MNWHDTVKGYIYRVQAHGSFRLYLLISIMIYARPLVLTIDSDRRSKNALYVWLVQICLDFWIWDPQAGLIFTFVDALKMFTWNLMGGCCNNKKQLKYLLLMQLHLKIFKLMKSKRTHTVCTGRGTLTTHWSILSVLSSDWSIQAGAHRRARGSECRSV